MDTHEINVVVFQDGDLWVAQCIEYDISARADTLTKIPRAIERALVANLRVNAELGRAGFDKIPQSPAYFRELFEAASLNISPRNPSGFKGPVRVRDLRLSEAA